MKSQTLPTSIESTTDDGDIYHLFCCDPDTGLCGVDLSDHLERPPHHEDQMCVVCDDLQQDDAWTCQVTECARNT